MSKIKMFSQTWSWKMKTSKHIYLIFENGIGYHKWHNVWFKSLGRKYRDIVPLNLHRFLNCWIFQAFDPSIHYWANHNLIWQSLEHILPLLEPFTTGRGWRPLVLIAGPKMEPFPTTLSSIPVPPPSYSSYPPPFSNPLRPLLFYPCFGHF